MSKDYFEKLITKRKQLSLQLSDPAANGFWQMVVDKYSEKAHFIYELLQNADDAKATSARFVLENDGLFFIHNGIIQFSVTDPDKEGDGTAIGHLNSITSIGSSSKVGGPSIGKFGIGFKSVFQYTDRPHIEDDNFCFSLENFIVPVVDSRILCMREPGETLFFLPFKDPLTAIPEILSTFKALGNPLFFINNLKTVSFYSEIDKTDFEWKISRLISKQTIGFEALSVCYEYIETQTPRREKEFYHLLKTPVEHDEKDGMFCAIVFSSDKYGNVSHVNSKHNCYCYFQLEDKLDIPFLIHAPFLLTENRELMKKNDCWNDSLFLLMGKLMVTIFQLNAKGWVNLASASPFDLLPPVTLQKRGVESAFLEAYVRLMKSSSCIRSTNGEFVDSEHALYSDDKQLQKVFTENTLPLLNGHWNACKWAFACINSYMPTEKKECLSFLSCNKLILQSLRLEDIIPFVSRDFLCTKTNEWLVSFYHLVSRNKAVALSESFKSSPFIKCSDGEFRPLTNEEGFVQIYLNKKNDNGGTFNLIYADDLFLEKELVGFCELVGLNEPSEFAYVEKVIRMRYQESKVERKDMPAIVSDLTRVAVCYSGLGYDTVSKDKLLALLRNVNFLPTINKNGARVFSRPETVYFETSETKAYFSSKPDVVFFDNDVIRNAQVATREKLYYFLQAIGVSFYPRIIEECIIPDKKRIEAHDLKPKSLRIHDNGAQQVEDKVIDGFDEMVDNWSESSSLAFFRLLGKMIGECGAFSFRKQLFGQYTYIEKGKQKPTKELLVKTTAYKQLYEKKWLPSCNHSAVLLVNVADSYDLSDKCTEADSDYYVMQLLGIKQNETLVGLNDEQKKYIKLLHSLFNKGVTIEDLEALKNGNAGIVYKK